VELVKVAFTIQIEGNPAISLRLQGCIYHWIPRVAYRIERGVEEEVLS
jgi:hypothetical protein